MPWDLDDLQENEEFAPVPPSEVARLAALKWTPANLPGYGSRVFPSIPCEMAGTTNSGCVPVDDESDPAVLSPAGFTLSIETPVSIRLEYDNGHELSSKSDHFLGHMLNAKTLLCRMRTHSYDTAPLTEPLTMPQTLDRDEPRLIESTEFDDDIMAVAYSESRVRSLDSATPLDVIPEKREPFKMSNPPLSNVGSDLKNGSTGIVGSSTDYGAQVQVPEKRRPFKLSNFPLGRRHVGSDTKNDSTGNVGSSTDSGTQLPEARLSFDQAILREREREKERDIERERANTLYHYNKQPVNELP